MPATLRRTPLFDRHLAAKAKIVDFAGWQMPIQYRGGVRAEHLAVREGCGVFDVSHMGRIETSGPRALPLLQRLITNDVAAIPIGGAQYGLICREDGGVLDDLFTYRLSQERYLTVTNAANHAADLAWFRSRLAEVDPSGCGVEVIDRSDELAMLAVQGPLARELCASLVDEASPRARGGRPFLGGAAVDPSGPPPLAVELPGPPPQAVELPGPPPQAVDPSGPPPLAVALSGPPPQAGSRPRGGQPGGEGESAELPPRMRAAQLSLASVPLLAAGTGYTGEDGLELILAAEQAPQLWDALLQAGAVPAGLGARDTLRIEACFHLYGNELTPQRNPIEAGLGWCCAERTGFVGSQAVAAARAAGPVQRLAAFTIHGGGIARPGNVVRGGGVVTSGTFSPSLQVGVGLAYLPVAQAVAGAEIEIDVRGTIRRATVRPKPLIASTINAKVKAND